MKTLLVVSVVIFASGIRCEPPPLQNFFGPPYRTLAAVNYGGPPRHHHHRQHSNHRHNYESYERPRNTVETFSSGFGDDYGSTPPKQSNQNQFRVSHSQQSHPNSLPVELGRNKSGYEVVRAPVIYHQTVSNTDNDLNKALADAFGVVRTLNRPGSRQEGSGGYQEQPVRTTVEFVNYPTRTESIAERPKTTTTTTIVEVPQEERRNPPPTTATAPVVAQRVPQDLPKAADVPPPAPTSSARVVASTAPQILTSSVALIPSAAPKLIIPSQSKVTTLNTSTDDNVRTIIQPVYIPYPVDQAGHPVGPLPDYHTMDFTAILSAQKQLVVAPPAPGPSVQLLGAQTVFQQPQTIVAPHVSAPPVQFLETHAVHHHPQPVVATPVQSSTVQLLESPKVYHQPQVVSHPQFVETHAVVQPPQTVVATPVQQQVQFVEQPTVFQQPQQLVQQPVLQQPQQLVHQPVFQQPQQLVQQPVLQQFVLQQDQSVAADGGNPSVSDPEPSPPPTGGYGRRRVRKGRRKARREN